jgi:hypothetical protein
MATNVKKDVEQPYTVFMINLTFFKPDAIRPVTVLSNQVDSVIDEGNAGSVNYIRNFHQLFLATESHNF